MTVTVRPVRRPDVEQIVAVGLRAWREGFKEVVSPDLVPDREEMARRIEHYAAKPGRPVTVAVGRLGGELCGYAAFGASRDHDAAPDVGGGTQRRHMSGGALEVRYRIGLQR